MADTEGRGRVEKVLVELEALGAGLTDAGPDPIPVETLHAALLRVLDAARQSEAEDEVASALLLLGIEHRTAGRDFRLN